MRTILLLFAASALYAQVQGGGYQVPGASGTGGSPTGAAGGSLGGAYPNPSIATSVALPGSPTTTTQSPADNSTKVATTAYVDAAVITNSPVYYVLPSGSGTTGASTDAANLWNGNVASSTTVSDANNCTAIATPCLTLQGVETKIHGKPLVIGAIPKIYVADTTNTGTDCLAPNTVTFSNPTAGLAPWSAGEQAVAGIYPPSYIYIYGNVSRTGVTIAGNGCGNSATFGARNAITADANTALRVRGFQFEGFGKSDTSYSAAVAAEGGSALYIEDSNNISIAASHNSMAGAFGPGSIIRQGGTFGISGVGNHSPFIAAFGATGYSWDPLATPTLNTNVNNSSTGVTGLWSGVDGSFFYVDRTTWNNTGNNSTILFTNLMGGIIYTEAYPASSCPSTPSVAFPAGEKCWSGTNNATGVTYQRAQENGFIDADCSNFTEGTCAATVQPSFHSSVNVGGFAREYATAGTNTQIFTGPDSIGSNGCVSTYTGAVELSTCGEQIIQFAGSTSGNASIGVAAAAGTPNKILLPTATGAANAVLVTNGANPQQTSFTITPTLTGTNFTGIPEAGLTLANNATNDVSTSKHGFAPILPNDATKFLNGVGGYTAPTGSAGAPTFPTNAQSSTYQVLAADFSACKTITVPSGTFAITLVASGSQPATGQCIFVINYGTGVATITRSGQNLNGGTGTLTVSAGSATAPTGAFIVSNGTDYIGQLFGSGAASGITGSGTSNNCAKFTGSAAIGSGGCTDDGTTFTVTDANFVAPATAGYAPTVAGTYGYDTTQKTPVIGGDTGLAEGLVRVLSVQRSTTDTILCSSVGAATETNFATTYTLPAGFLIAGKIVEVTITGTLQGTSGFLGYLTNLKLCASGACLGSAVATSMPIATLGANKTNAQTGATFLIQGTAAAGGSVNVITSIPSTNTQTPWIAGNVGTAQPVAFATNGALTIQVSETCNQNTGLNSVTLNQMIIKSLN